MSRQTVLVTGGMGCIGAGTVRWLIDHTDANIVVCSRTAAPERVARVFPALSTERLSIAAIDVTDSAALIQLIRSREVTRVVHLAALQTPDCNANRDLGLQINLAGTQNLLEAIKQAAPEFERFVFASSIAVYGGRAAYPAGTVPLQAAPAPVNAYGVWKLAGEHLCRIFTKETGIPAISLRPGVLFGPGRDAGLTSTPTTAMKCVALGQPYTIPFRSRQDYLYAPDVGAAFGHVVMSDFSDYGVFTLPSKTLTTEQFVSALATAADELDLGHQFDIRVGDEEVPFICDLDYRDFTRAFPDAPHTTLHEALRESLHVFRDHMQRGWLAAADVA